MRRRIRSVVAATVIAACTLVSAGPSDVEKAREFVDRVRTEAGPIPQQAEALVDLAWLGGSDDPTVRAVARDVLVMFGHQSLPELRAAVSRVPRRFTADVVGTLYQARMRERAGVPGNYLVGLEDAVWYGSVEAKHQAILLLAFEKYPPAMLACIDAAYDHPELVEVVVRALATYRDPRARYYLGERLERGPEPIRRLAADALASIGEEAHDVLREATRSSDTAVQTAAVQALLPSSTPDDLMTLYEFLERHADEETSVVRDVRTKTEELELRLQNEQDRDAATSEPFEN